MTINHFNQTLFSYGLTALFIMLTLTGSLKNKRIIKLVGYIGLALSTIVDYYVGLIDNVSLLFSTLALIVGASSSMYCDVYEVDKYGTRDLHILIDIFSLSVYATFASPNLALFIVSWFLAEITGFFAIIYEVKPENFRAGLRYLIVSMIPSDLALLTTLGYLSIRMDFMKALTLPMKYLFMGVETLPLHISLIIITGFSAKAAIAPLHFWLPDAHSLAPAPASSILSGIMVKMGLYGILRVLLSTETSVIPALYIVLGSISAIYGGLLAIAQTDIKRILAYSTIENTGLMMIVLMRYRLLEDPIPIYGFYTLVSAHALFKSALFMNSGTVEVLTHTRDITKLGFLSRVAPLSATSALLSALSLIGIPPTLGFMAKLLVIESSILFVSANVIWGVALTVVVTLASALTVVYTVKYLTIYWGFWSTRSSLKLNPVEKHLVFWELIPASFSVVSSIILPFVYYTSLSIEIFASLVFSLMLFLVITIYMYIRTKRISQDYVWLGGEYP